MAEYDSELVKAYMSFHERSIANFKASVVADSCTPNWQGLEDEDNRVTTMVIRMPKNLVGEFNTHRALSRNSASSRAIPIAKVIEEINLLPALPVRWGKAGKGMQDDGWFTEPTDIARCVADRLESRNHALLQMQIESDNGLAKQVCNRLGEPFMWTEVVVTASYWQNFFALRVDQAADPSFQRVAYLMLKAYLDSEPTKLMWGQWHTPLANIAIDNPDVSDPITRALEESTASCGRVSYKRQETVYTYEEQKARHDQFVSSGHWSTTEHCARAIQTPHFQLDQEKRTVKNTSNGNLGHFWQQYRKTFPNENRRIDLKEHLAAYESAINSTTAKNA